MARQITLLAQTPDEDTEFLKHLKPKKTIQIAVSGSVYITDIERRIIDTTAFQRLRGVRQLGGACWVYPTAIHTRFDHSLGTLAMADAMIKSIKENAHNSTEEKSITSKQETLVRLYALLHDVTHIPFGHSIEDELNIFKRHDKNEERINYFLGPESEIGKIIVKNFGEQFLQDFLIVYKWDEKDDTWVGKPEEVFLHDLVSNTVCADLLDYLKRDDYFCNLGVKLEYNFLKYLYLGVEKNTGFRRVFVRLWKKESQPRRDLLTDLARLLESRYIIAERVYFHHAKSVTGAMLGRALQEASELEEITEVAMYDHSDDTLLRELTKSKSPIAQRLATNLRRRHLHKIARTYNEEDFGGVQGHDHSHHYIQAAFDKVDTPEKRRRFEDRLAAQIGVEPGDILIYAPDREMNLKLAGMRVLWHGETMAFSDITDSVVTPKLKATVEAHRRLWQILVVADQKLNSRQLDILQNICDFEFICPQSSLERERKMLFREIVSFSIEGKFDLEKPYKELRSTIEKCADELAEDHHLAGDWSSLLDKTIRRHFGDPAL